MKARTTSIAILLCLASAGLMGQTTLSSGSEAPASQDDILKLFDVMQIRNQMKLVMQQMSQQMRSLGHEQIRKRDPKVTDEQIAKLDAMSDEITRDFPIDGLLADMVPVYQKHLSKSDVDAMIGFYSTPTGQKILRELPAITAEGMQAMQPRLREVMDEANDRLDRMIREQMPQKKQESATQPNTVKN